MDITRRSFGLHTTLGAARRRTRARLAGAFVVLASLALLAQGAGSAVLVGSVPMVNQPAGAAVNPATNRIYVANEESPYHLRVIDGATNTVVTDVGVGYKPRYVAVNPNTNRVYVTHYWLNRVSVIDGAANSVVGNMYLGSTNPLGVDVNPATNRIYVAGVKMNASVEGVFVIDGTTNSVIATVSAGSLPQGVGVNATTNRIYVSNSLGNTVSVIDGAANSVVATVPVGSFPASVAVNPATNRVYVVNNGDNTVSVIDGSSSTVVATLAMSGNPIGIDVDPTVNRVYVSLDAPTDVVAVIDGADNSVIGTAALATSVGAPGGNDGLAVNPLTHRIYVSHGGPANVVSVLEDDVTPPVVSVSFPAPDGQNGWFVTSPVTGTVTADDTATGGSNIEGISCTGATIGSITGLGTASAVAPLTVSAEGVSSVGCSADDSAGNSGAGPGSTDTATVKLDSVAPTILITSPAAGGGYLLGAAVASDYSCTDATSGVAGCAGPVASGADFSTSPVGPHAFTVGAADVAGNQAQATSGYRVVYDFAGFFRPIDNLPVLNSAKAGSAVPVRFSLGGPQGMDVFAAGYPKSQTIACDATALVDGVEETVAAGSSSLSYDASSGQYTYVWKTLKSSAGTCQQLVVKLSDDTVQRANFLLK